MRRSLIYTHDLPHYNVYLHACSVTQHYRLATGSHGLSLLLCTNAALFQVWRSGSHTCQHNGTTRRYTWKGLVGPMWSLIRFAARMADLTLVTSKVMKVRRPSQA